MPLNIRRDQNHNEEHLGSNKGNYCLLPINEEELNKKKEMFLKNLREYYSQLPSNSRSKKFVDYLLSKIEESLNLIDVNLYNKILKKVVFSNGINEKIAKTILDSIVFGMTYSSFILFGEEGNFREKLKESIENLGRIEVNISEGTSYVYNEELNQPDSSMQNPNKKSLVNVFVVNISEEFQNSYSDETLPLFYLMFFKTAFHENTHLLGRSTHKRYFKEQITLLSGKLVPPLLTQSIIRNNNSIQFYSITSRMPSLHIYLNYTLEGYGNNLTLNEYVEAYFAQLMFISVFKKNPNPKDFFEKFLDLIRKFSKTSFSTSFDAREITRMFSNYEDSELREAYQKTIEILLRSIIKVNREHTEELTPGERIDLIREELFERYKKSEGNEKQILLSLYNFVSFYSNYSKFLYLYGVINRREYSLLDKAFYKDLLDFRKITLRELSYDEFLFKNTLRILHKLFKERTKDTLFEEKHLTYNTYDIDNPILS